MKYKAVFLDNDGTINNFSTEKSTPEFTDDIVEGLQRLQSYGYLLVVVSNQNGVAHGYSSVEDVEKAKSELYDSCAHLGIYLDGFYYCPHDPQGSVAGYNTACDCRRPLPGLILRASDEMGIDLSQSWMIGNILNDVEAGNRAGCRSVMVNNGNEKRWVSGAYRLPEYFAGGLAEASKFIIAAEKMRNIEQQMEREEKQVLQPMLKMNYES